MWRRDFTCCNLWIILFSVLCFSSLFCYSDDTISTGEQLKDGEEIVSAGKKFALGFFSPNGSDFRYLGIWYYDIPVQTVIWVANRNNPISGDNGVLTIAGNGNLVVLDRNGGSAVWSSSSTSSVSPTNSTAILTDNGNLILLNNSHAKVGDRTFWESFRNPTDTYLPDMRAYLDSVAETRVFTSWRSESDPSTGNYTLGIDPRGAPQIVIRDGQNRRWRSGHWNGLIFTGIPGVRAIYLYGFRLTQDDDGRYYFTYTPSNKSDLIKFRLLWSGYEEHTTWDANTGEWSLIQLLPGRECDQFNKCGSFGICDVENSPICSCMTGFEPVDVVQWNSGNWSGGCVRKTELQCSNNSNSTSDEFLQIDLVKLPDFLDYVGPEDLSGCREKCLRNCSCIAFSFVSGINCMMWSSDNLLVDTQHFAVGGNTLFLRLADSELGE